ncbi:hypothetical protein BV22DRAFT_1009446 [Leucogyrophana mollusca]|uniref:Uncharacterized protein n=1 Tax=Leucogyrophana mollusca TaxID=85980 RepID=A0ACB8BK92_9AGAM|nr:hypothetical protein BV22DRAFT_1009446 [Leucogyrophana mollusca]
MSFALVTARNVLRLAPTRSPLTAHSFVSDILPPIACYFATAVLVLIPRTRWIRLALWPITLLLAFRAALSTDFSMNDPRQAFWNIDLLAMFCVATRSLEWTLPKQPLRRRHPSGEKSKTASHRSLVLLNALDLMINLRGHDWDWSDGLYVPPETRPATSRTRFVLTTVVSGVVHALTCGALQTAVQTFSPSGFGSLNGGTIFDLSLSLPARYFRSSIIATMTAFGVYNVLQCGYELTTIAGIILLRQEYDQWPRAFEAPWTSTSLREFWGKRWHQWFRRTFVFLGARPLSYFGGRVGGIMGAFLASAVFHHLALLVLDENAQLWRMIVPFSMMGFGMILERVYMGVSGRKVGGWAGWVWTMFWLLLWGNFMVDAWAEAGMLGCSTILDNAAPVRGVIVHTIASFDRFLHQYAS